MRRLTLHILSIFLSLHLIFSPLATTFAYAQELDEGSTPVSEEEVVTPVEEIINEIPEDNSVVTEDEALAEEFAPAEEQPEYEEYAEETPAAQTQEPEISQEPEPVSSEEEQPVEAEPQPVGPVESEVSPSDQIEEERQEALEQIPLELPAPVQDFIDGVGVGPVVDGDSQDTLVSGYSDAAAALANDGDQAAAADRAAQDDSSGDSGDSFARRPLANVGAAADAVTEAPAEVTEAVVDGAESVFDGLQGLGGTIQQAFDNRDQEGILTMRAEELEAEEQARLEAQRLAVEEALNRSPEERSRSVAQALELPEDTSAEQVVNELNNLVNQTGIKIEGDPDSFTLTEAPVTEDELTEQISLALTLPPKEREAELERIKQQVLGGTEFVANLVTQDFYNLFKHTAEIQFNELPRVEQLKTQAGFDDNYIRDNTADYLRQTKDLQKLTSEQLEQQIQGLYTYLTEDEANRAADQLRAKKEYADALKEVEQKARDLQQEAQVTGALALAGYIPVDQLAAPAIKRVAQSVETRTGLLSRAQNFLGQAGDFANGLFGKRVTQELVQEGSQRGYTSTLSDFTRQIVEPSTSVNLIQSPGKARVVEFMGYPTDSSEIERAVAELKSGNIDATIEILRKLDTGLVGLDIAMSDSAYFGYLDRSAFDATVLRMRDVLNQAYEQKLSVSRAQEVQDGVLTLFHGTTALDRMQTGGIAASSVTEISGRRRVLVFNSGSGFYTSTDFEYARLYSDVGQTTEGGSAVLQIRIKDVGEIPEIWMTRITEAARKQAEETGEDFLTIVDREIARLTNNAPIIRIHEPRSEGTVQDVIPQILIRDKSVLEKAEITALNPNNLETMASGLRVNAESFKPIEQIAEQTREKGLVERAVGFVTNPFQRAEDPVVVGVQTAIAGAPTRGLASEVREAAQTSGVRETQEFVESKLREHVSQTLPFQFQNTNKAQIEYAIQQETARLLDMEVFYHYSPEAGARGVVESGVLRGSKEKLGAGGVYVTDIPPYQIQPTRGGNTTNRPTNLLDLGMFLGNSLGITHQVGIKKARLTDYFVIYAPKDTFQPTLANRLGGSIREWTNQGADIALNDSNVVVKGPFKNTDLSGPPSVIASILLSTATVGATFAVEYPLISAVGGVLSPGTSQPTREELDKAIRELNNEFLYSDDGLERGESPNSSFLPWNLVSRVYAAENSSVGLTIGTETYEVLVKQKIVKNRLAATGVADSSFIKNTMAMDSVGPRFGKTEKGYVFVTGKAGSVQGSVEPGSYIIEIESIEGIKIRIPKVVRVRSGFNVVVPVSFSNGSGEVERVKTLSGVDGVADAQSNINLVIFDDENRNGNLDGDESPLGLAGVQVELKNMNQDKLVSLLPGWNLVTLTAVPSKPLTASGLVSEIAKQEGYATTISTLENGSWKSFVQRGDKEYTGEDFAIEPGKAYFVKALKRSVFFYQGQEFVEPLKLSLDSGWNAVGIPKTNRSYKAMELLSNVVGEADTIARWESGLWDTFVKKTQEGYGENFPIEQNRGYIIKVGKEVEFTP
ncbi:MAG: hypothetical protein HYU80_02840 [Candidatus Blackburnbacteria bacterium]|nr:hypothetical protein [Candidatus Blackburnbacteria bacterium]